MQFVSVKWCVYHKIEEGAFQQVHKMVYIQIDKGSRN
jgi:hypothetical protein